MSTYVSIGRNDGPDGPELSAARWRLFRADVAEAILFWAAPIVSETEGSGYYDGAAETTAIVVGAGEPTGDARLAFELRIGHIARSYGQECIAVAYAGPTFIPAARSSYTAEDRAIMESLERMDREGYPGQS